MPDCRIGAVIMKMIRRTRTTSINGTMLMSERLVCVDLVSCGMRGGRPSGKSFFDLGGEFKGKSVETLGEVANILEEVVVGDEGRDSRKESGGGGHQSFGDAGSYGAKAGGAGGAETGEGVNDAPNRAEETDERRYAGGGSEPGHAFFDASHFLRGSELHRDRDGLHGL